MMFQISGKRLAGPNRSKLRFCRLCTGCIPCTTGSKTAKSTWLYFFPTGQRVNTEFSTAALHAWFGAERILLAFSQEETVLEFVQDSILPTMNLFCFGWASSCHIGDWKMQ